METKKKEIAFEELKAQNNKLIQEATTFLEQNGQKFQLSEWVTIAEYTKRFNLKSTMVITNWIKRGIIPPENIVHVPELNDIRLIKAVPYQE